MKSKFMVNDDFKAVEKSVTLLHGCFDKSFFQRFKDQKEMKVYITEGRPTLRAAQSNCSQLNKVGTNPTLICDNMAGFLFAKDMVKEVWIAYDEQDAEGLTVAIGGSILAVLGMRHQIPVYAYPSDKKNKTLADPKELLSFLGVRVAPKGAKTYVPLVEHVELKYFNHVAMFQ